MKHEFAVKLRGGPITRPTIHQLGETNYAPSISHGRGLMEAYRRELLRRQGPEDPPFVVDYHQYAYRVAAHLGVRVRVRKREQGGWDCWRLT